MRCNVEGWIKAKSELTHVPRDTQFEQMRFKTELPTPKGCEKSGKKINGSD